ncbi:MAG: hypothetical protein AAGD33_09990 [Actinomycetota bacterium]
MAMFVDRDELRTAFENLTALPFPAHPDDIELADWVLELAEIDGHIAGLATGALGASRPQTIKSHAATSHLARLRDIRVVGDDECMYDACIVYAQAVERVESALNGGSRAGC